MVIIALSLSKHSANPEISVSPLEGFIKENFTEELPQFITKIAAELAGFCC
jgi:hypothetical protein